ncbi:CubicO group peptidase, beta-lactamase class C family [Ekhidna lutea]|uniref:CubicO group peptidase, beta-lactamase class C family n=1 Tax=Ekhidna lutea TaxID=447679 RepID=A0A239HCU5_EKHLU|nr:serine hydrolase [Ekhidna lutea]SNS78985.1 CubicO group peptidase, beta-lactamase class C family [Ekhidna lutea]
MRKLQHTLSVLFFFAIVCTKGQSIEKLQLAIDSIVSNAIEEEAFPGCVIYASKGDSVFLLKSYGFHTYDSSRRVAVNDIYDIASITKVVGGTLAMMKLYEDGHYDLDDEIRDYINKIGRKVGKVTFREALAHQGGLYPWIPYYSEVKRKSGKWKNNTVTNELDEDYGYPISDSLYLHSDFYDKIKQMIRKSDVSDVKKYRYSGLFFYLIPELVHSLTDTLYKDYLNVHFYDKLGAETLTFNPLKKYDLSQIVPTEIDTFFRMHPIHGKVHDEGAIMMKGISGNAGLFSNATDLGKVFRMFLNNGKYDTLQILSPQTIRLFTTSQYPNNENRRGLGFDKPLLEYDSIRSSVAKDASFESYGHTGYTGTLAWADPDSELVFIFLTNRVYPDRTHRALYQLNVRPTIHQLLSDYLNTEISVYTDPVGNTK